MFKAPTAAVNEGHLRRCSASLPAAVALSTDGQHVKMGHIYSNLMTEKGRAAVDNGKWRIMYIGQGFNCDPAGNKKKSIRNELAKQNKDRLFRWQSCSQVLAATGNFPVPNRLEGSIVHLYRVCEGEMEPGHPCTNPEVSDVYECYAAEALCRKHFAGVSVQHVCGNAEQCKRRRVCNTPFTKSGRSVKCPKLVCAHKAVCPELEGQEFCRRHFAKEHGEGCNCANKRR